MAKSLSDFVKDNSKFLKLQDGQHFKGFYLGYKIVPDTFNPDKEKVVYKLKYLDGKEVFFQTSSVRVAGTFMQYKGGENIKITRRGTGTSTSYEIEKYIEMGPQDADPDFNSPEFSGDPDVL